MYIVFLLYMMVILCKPFKRQLWSSMLFLISVKRVKTSLKLLSELKKKKKKKQSITCKDPSCPSEKLRGENNSTWGERTEKTKKKKSQSKYFTCAPLY